MHWFKKLGTGLIFLITLSCAFAQPPDTLWTRTLAVDSNFAFELMGLISTSDGGFLVGGVYAQYGESCASRGFLIKADESGSEEWEISHLSPDDAYDPSLFDLKKNDQGRIFGTGIWVSDGSYPYVAEFSETGDTLWRSIFADDSRNAEKLDFSTNGSIYVFGYGAQEDLYPVLARLSSTGEPLWFREFEYFHEPNPYLYFCDVGTAGHDNDYVFAAAARDTVQGNHELLIFCKVDDNGDTVLTKSLGNSEHFWGPLSVIASADGGFFVSIEYENRLIKLNNNLDTLWTRTYDTDIYPELRNMVALPDGGFICGWEADRFINPPGVQRYCAFYARFDANGDSVWTTLLCEASQERLTGRISPLPDGGYICAWINNDFFSTLGLARLEPDTHTVSSSENRIQVAGDIELFQNYPNPFNSSTRITYVLPRPCRATLTVYDIMGRVVQTLTDGLLPGGTYSTMLSGSEWSSGVYFVRFQADGFRQTRKMLLLK